jgi:adenosylmethionine-8-amino-7-oxononanoate aminotransferase
MDLLERDLRHVWHPFTQAREWERQDNLCIVAGEGAYLVDSLGRRYLDGTSSLWCNVHGHRHPRIDAAVRAQLDQVAHSTLLGLTHPNAVVLAERLVALTSRHLPGDRPLTRVFYSDSGSTAVEVALKMAFQACQQRGEGRRTRIAALDQAYHGDTLGSVSVGGIDLFHEVYRPLLFDAVRIPAPERPDPVLEDVLLARARATFEAHGDTLCAFVFEPRMQGAAGMRMHSARYLRELCAMARAAGALLVADEVATGFGRTGSMFASGDVAPDILCVAKGLTGGYLPLAATLTTEAVHACFCGPYTEYRTFFHGHTYTGNPLACAAALACLDVFEEERTLERMVPSVDALAAALAGLRHPAVTEVRHLGMMGAVVLEGASPAARTGHRVALAARAHGAIVRNLGDTVMVVPPLCCTPEQVGALVGAVAHAVDDVCGTAPGTVG